MKSTISVPVRDRLLLSGLCPEEISRKLLLPGEIDKDPDLLIAVQPTRGVDIGAIEFIHKQLIEQRDAGKAVLLVSLELDEVMDVPDRILVMYEGKLVGEFKPMK